MFSITKQTDYALVTVANLRDREGFIPLTELIEKTHMPRRFLARITADLVRHGVLESKEGKTGGYRLKQSPKEISLYDFLKIFEGDLQIVGCTEDPSKCMCRGSCQHQSFFKGGLPALFRNELQKLTLEDVFQTTKV